MANEARPAGGILHMRVSGQKIAKLGINPLRQQIPRALAQDLRQRIGGNSRWITERQKRSVLLAGESRRVDTATICYPINPSQTFGHCSRVSLTDHMTIPGPQQGSAVRSHGAFLSSFCKYSRRRQDPQRPEAQSPDTTAGGLQGSQSSSVIRPRSALISPRSFLLRRRRFLDPRLGLVGMRRFGACEALRIRSASLSRAISRLRA